MSKVVFVHLAGSRPARNKLGKKAHSHFRKYIGSLIDDGEFFKRLSIDLQDLNRQYPNATPLSFLRQRQRFSTFEEVYINNTGTNILYFKLHDLAKDFTLEGGTS